MSNLLKICAVIVTYNPVIPNLYKLIGSLDSQAIKSFIVDNNSSVPLRLPNCISLDSNMGIAFAQNIGISAAVDFGADYILFFDQDSSVSEDYIEQLLYDYQKLLTVHKNIGAIGPRFIDDRFGFYYKTVDMKKNGFRNKLDVSNISEPLHSSILISSGSLIAVDTLKIVGGMRENYFIDYVDTEWCIRAESLGYRNYVSSNAVMKHTIGDNIIQLKFFNVPVHSPFRRYYRVRNAFYMLKEPHVPVLLGIREVFFNFVHQAILILFLSQKKEYINSYLRGVRDGVLYLFKKRK